MLLKMMLLNHCYFYFSVQRTKQMSQRKNHQKGDLTPPSCPKIPKLGHLFALQSWRFQKLSKQPSAHGLHQRKSVNNQYKTLFKLKFATHKLLLESLLDQQIING